MRSLRILVVDDGAVIGMLLGEMLEEMGHTVCGIETSEADAVSATALLAPDLLIIDAFLGDGSGVEAVKAVTRDKPVPHLFVSGDLSVVKAAMPGSAMLHKPYNESELARGIRRALEAAPAS